MPVATLGIAENAAFFRSRNGGLGFDNRRMVELRGIEPLTSSLRTMRSPS